MNPNDKTEQSREKMPAPKLSEENKDKVITARVNLYSDHPFFAQLSQYLVPTGSWMVPTAGVTGQAKFFLNPNFADKCNVKDMTFVVAHETMHLVTVTSSRMPEGANHMLWNIASDIAINYLIINKEHGAGIAPPRPEVCKPLYDGEFQKYWGWTTEDIYYDLLKHIKSCPACGGGGQEQDQGQSQGGGNSGDGEGDQQPQSGDGSGDKQSQSGKGSGKPQSGKGKPQKHAPNCPFKGYWWDDSGATCGDKHSEDGMSEEEAAEWKQRVANAAAEARQAGKLPGALGNFVTDIMQPKKNWRRELRMAANRALRKRYDWKRVARRTAGMVRTPGKSPYMPEALLYMDTSGSMSDDDLREAIAEMAEIVRLAGGKCKLILGDAEVYYYGEVDLQALTNLPVQRGGTNFIPVFEKIEEEDLKPAIFVGFTDLEGPFPMNPPNYPVVWCRPQGWKSDAPWGRIIDIEL